MFIVGNLEEFLKAAQEKMNYPEGLRLNLYNKQIGAEEVKAIAMALQSGHCPQGLQLNLGDNQIGAKGAKAIATALQSDHCPQGLQLNLYDNQIGAKGAKALAAALQSGHCPQGLQLNLGDNQIGAKGAKAVATALQSGHCPQGLQLYLGDNQIDAKGAKAIATALQSGHCPQGLQLHLDYNQIDTKGAKALATALQSDHCPQGLQLTLSGNWMIDAEGEKAFKKAWEIYYLQQQEKFLECATLQQGKQQVDSPISQLPQEILDEIYRHSVPATPVLAKMTEISAKVFRQCYASGIFSGKSPAANRLDKDLEIALSTKTLTKRAEAIKVSTENFLRNELGTLKKGEFTHSPMVALLCHYHLIARNKVNEDTNHRDHFQLREQQTENLVTRI